MCIRDRPRRSAHTAASRLTRAARAAGLEYRDSAPAATFRFEAGISTRGLRRFGTTMYGRDSPAADADRSGPGYSWSTTSAR